MYMHAQKEKDGPRERYIERYGDNDNIATLRQKCKMQQHIERNSAFFNTCRQIPPTLLPPCAMSFLYDNAARGSRVSKKNKLGKISFASSVFSNRNIYFGEKHRSSATVEGNILVITVQSQ